MQVVRTRVSKCLVCGLVVEPAALISVAKSRTTEISAFELSAKLKECLSQKLCTDSGSTTLCLLTL